MKKILSILAFLLIVSGVNLYAQEEDAGAAGGDLQGQAQDQALNYALGGVFGAVTIDGKNYQQMGLRPEFKLWKLGVGLDITILLDDEGKIREEDWDQVEDYIDKIYYIKFGTRGKDPLYFTYGGLESTTLGYGTLIYGYTNMLEYPTYKRQGLDVAIDTPYFGMQAIASDFKELLGSNKALVGGGRFYIKPFSRLQIGGSIAGDTNEYKGLRDTDDDGTPDEVDAYPEDRSFSTEIDKYRSRGIDDATIATLVAAGLLDPTESADLINIHKNRSQTGFWAGDAGLNLINGDFVRFDIYAQYAKSLNTGGWGFTAPGVRLSFGSVLELYGDYRQQTEDFVFAYYNSTYDLERAKFVDDGTGNLRVATKLDKLNEAQQLRGYFGGAKLNIFNLVTGTAEYQDMRWGEEDTHDKSLKGELQVNKELIPMLTKAKAYYIQNNVEKIRWKTESTVMGAVVGIGVGEGLSIDFKYLITYEDINGDGEIKGGDETITNVSVSTSTAF